MFLIAFVFFVSKVYSVISLFFCFFFLGHPILVWNATSVSPPVFDAVSANTNCINAIPLSTESVTEDYYESWSEADGYDACESDEGSSSGEEDTTSRSFVFLPIYVFTFQCLNNSERINYLHSLCFFCYQSQTFDLPLPAPSPLPLRELHTCDACGKSSHRSQRHHLCPYNKNNTVPIARRPFQEDVVRGLDIETHNYDTTLGTR